MPSAFPSHTSPPVAARAARPRGTRLSARPGRPRAPAASARSAKSNPAPLDRPLRHALSAPAQCESPRLQSSSPVPSIPQTSRPHRHDARDSQHKIPAPSPLLKKHRQHHRDVRQMRPSCVRIVQNRDVSRRKLNRRNRRLHAHRHRSQVNRHVVAHRNRAPAPVKHRARIIASLLDVWR